MRIVKWEDGIIQVYVWVIVAFILVLTATVIAALRSVKNKSPEISGFYPILDLSKFWHLVIFFFTAGAILGLAFTGINPFIYFQF
jgi:alginate O-acetyltransferase complex protein AlgI